MFKIDSLVWGFGILQNKYRGTWESLWKSSNMTILQTFLKLTYARGLQVHEKCVWWEYAQASRFSPSCWPCSIALVDCSEGSLVPARHWACGVWSEELCFLVLASETRWWHFSAILNLPARQVLSEHMNPKSCGAIMLALTLTLLGWFVHFGVLAKQPMFPFIFNLLVCFPNVVDTGPGTHVMHKRNNDVWCQQPLLDFPVEIWQTFVGTCSSNRVGSCNWTYAYGEH